MSDRSAWRRDAIAILVHVDRCAGAGGQLAGWHAWNQVDWLEAPRLWKGVLIDVRPKRCWG